MSADSVIDILAREGSFSARRLEFHFPVRVLEHLSLASKYFFSLLSKTSAELSLDQLINNAWRSDPVAVKAYHAMAAEERLEVNALIGFVLHETTHKVDLLVSPFGVQYIGLLIWEYQLLQDYLPRALDHKNYLEALRVLPNLTSPPKAILAEAEVRELWSMLSEVVRKAMSWGDLGGLRPGTSQVAVGWDGHIVEARKYFGGYVEVEPVKVLSSFYSFRPLGARNWYLRPMTVLEAKALANTMLYLLDISDNVQDVALYYDRVYLSRKADLEPDYLFLLDLLAQIHGIPDFATALGSGRKDLVRHLLVLTSSLGWFALQAPPAIRGKAEVGSVGANPVVRLFAALAHLKPYLQKNAQKSYTTTAQLFLDLEKRETFERLEQPLIAAALASSREALRGMRDQVGNIWNPNVRERFGRVLDIMTPHFEKREDNYRSYMGMPDNGNARCFVKTREEMELFYHDHAPAGDYAEWLEMRSALLFAHAMPHKELVGRLERHFEAVFLVYPCKHCDTMHHFWVSRFADDFTAICSVTGVREQIKMPDVKRVVLHSD